MTQSTPPGINDLLGLFGGNNPFSVVTKSIGQFQRGVSDFLSAVENFNKTMEQMHVMANRVNSLLDTVEEPIKSLVPQISRTIRTADAMVEQLSAPIDRVAPGLSTLADVLASPTLTAMPKELADFMAVLSELARRLQPLGAMAESAGSMFGLRPFAAMLGSSSAAGAARSPRRHRGTGISRRQSPVKKAAAKRAPAKKAPAKKAPAAKKAPPPRSRCEARLEEGSAAQAVTHSSLSSRWSAWDHR